MEVYSRNIFVSYTTLDKEINRQLLSKIDVILSKFGKVYIDLLHNNDEHPQEKVISELEKTDILIVIDTPFVGNSKWVKFELDSAHERNIKIIRIGIKDILSNKIVI